MTAKQEVIVFPERVQRREKRELKLNLNPKKTNRAVLIWEKGDF